MNYLDATFQKPTPTHVYLEVCHTSVALAHQEVALTHQEVYTRLQSNTESK